MALHFTCKQAHSEREDNVVVHLSVLLILIQRMIDCVRGGGFVIGLHKSKRELEVKTDWRVRRTMMFELSPGASWTELSSSVINRSIF